MSFTVLTCNPELFVSNYDWDSDYRDWRYLWFSSVPPTKYTRCTRPKTSRRPSWSVLVICILTRFCRSHKHAARYVRLPAYRDGKLLMVHSVAFSPRSNYADRATAACRRSRCQLLRIEGCRVVSTTNPHGSILVFLHRSRYFLFQVIPQLYLRGWVDPFRYLLLFRKCGNAGNRARDLWICSQELWPLDHRGGLLSFT
jgi:hypothetical protein